MFLDHLRPWTLIMTGPERFVRVPRADVEEGLSLKFAPTFTATLFLLALAPTHSCGEGFVIAGAFTGEPLLQVLPSEPCSLASSLLEYPPNLCGGNRRHSQFQYPSGLTGIS